MIKLRSDLYSRTTPHSSPLRASYGVSFVSYTKNNDRDISRAYFILCGILYIDVVVLGGVLGPPLYGYLQDKTCLHWSKDCYEDRACWVHDRQAYRYWLHGITILLLALALLFYTIAHFIIGKKSTSQDQENPEAEHEQNERREDVSLSNLEINVMWNACQI